MLTFLGDIALIDNNARSDFKPEYPYIFNCEYVIGNANLLSPIPGKINLIGTNSDFSNIFGKNPIAVTLTNNHINDYGEEGYLSTKEVLENKGIHAIDTEPFFFNNICILAFMNLPSKNKKDGILQFDKDKAIKLIEKVKSKEVKHIIVVMHWGIENNPNPTKKQEDNAHWLIDHGVDLIIGHHPHCIQSVEKYKGKFIFYSLGNGLFPPINQPSHYTESGIPTRKYRFNWCIWNRLSYAVTINENMQIKVVHELYQDKNNVIKVKRKINVDELLKKKKVSPLVYLIRKYWLFLVSNSFVDGKIIDIEAIRAEMKNV